MKINVTLPMFVEYILVLAKPESQNLTFCKKPNCETYIPANFFHICVYDKVFFDLGSIHPVHKAFSTSYFFSFTSTSKIDFFFLSRLQRCLLYPFTFARIIVHLSRFPVVVEKKNFKQENERTFFLTLWLYVSRYCCLLWSLLTWLKIRAARSIWGLCIVNDVLQVLSCTLLF